MCPVLGCMQAAFIVLLLPLMTSLQGIALADLPTYLAQGEEGEGGVPCSCPDSTCAWVGATSPHQSAQRAFHRAWPGDVIAG